MKYLVLAILLSVVAINVGCNKTVPNKTDDAADGIKESDWHDFDKEAPKKERSS